ncbi:DUF4326 domain-containing protein [Promicromonospora thailandica]|uniref:DUF4326 domain-containing protein n=1 Tax=Promicromonospora thailandica TaxID=765201 RepID=A0A9X2JVX5_9MICO|nr:DUF4326 domain-containing protein [Promicromonospora thailandica]MCP2265546.1 protein of unknown function (DUF4326) [Promicromonospora thailandica]BFF17111.1 DUF4326 domain-containing protein [Promicromonospora thailandica]
MPDRIQLRRTKGWRKPEGAVVVARPSKWGNPFRPVRCDRRLHDDGYSELVGPHWHVVADDQHVLALRWKTRGEALANAVRCYRLRVTNPKSYAWEEIRAELAGRDLACWCPLDQPCHADVLLEIANGGAPA